MELDREKYIKVRMAQGKGARTLEELKDQSDIIIENEEEAAEIEKLLKNACKCKNVSVEDVLNAIDNGADTLDKVMEVTKAGTGCGRCKNLLQNIIENKR